MTRAIVLAAGMGSRLLECTALPKPLCPVAGIPLIVRVLETLASAGIVEAVVVTGYRGEQVRRALRSAAGLGLSLTCLENPDYHLKNGVSLLAAKAFVDRDCLLSMSDHLYPPELPRRLLAADLPVGACALGIDHDIERCFDLEDATKVRVERGLVRAIGKELDAYDAIDTGVFRIGAGLIREIERRYADAGDCSLSDGVAGLCCHERFFATDIGDAPWIDVDTPASLEHAEAMLPRFAGSERPKQRNRVTWSTR